jgi:hypothetical protein
MDDGAVQHAVTAGRHSSSVRCELPFSWASTRRSRSTYRADTVVTATKGEPALPCLWWFSFFSPFPLSIAFFACNIDRRPGPAACISMAGRPADKLPDKPRASPPSVLVEPTCFHVLPPAHILIAYKCVWIYPYYR